MPPETVPLGRQDEAAVQQLQAYRQAVQSVSWTGMQGQGEYTPNAPNASGAATGSEPATLWISGDHNFRLDIQTATGGTSIRMAGTYGATRHEDGHIRRMDSRSALKGFFAFPRLLRSGFPAASLTLIDQGVAVVDGARLHRITIGIPWPEGLSANHSQPPTTVIDLYFDSRTNLLTKSATVAAGSTSESTRYLRVISYGDYQTTGGMVLPYLYSERFNGQLLWTLQLNSVELHPGLTDSEFTF